jgi:hypothetical protein
MGANDSGVTQKGDFLVIEGSNREPLDSLYRLIKVVGCTLDEPGLIDMAKGIQKVRCKDPSQVKSAEDAVCVLEVSGWIIIRFMN